MEWSCGSLSTGQEVSPPQGYTVALTDMDCIGSWVQQLTIRPVPLNAPTRMEVELYGQLGDRVIVPLTSTLSGETFDYRHHGLHVAGTLLSHNNQGADVDIDAIEFYGIDVCDADFYTFEPEE